jgi:hypothetical protein
MATARPFSYNPSQTLISGTTQIGDLCVGVPITGFTNSPQFWNGPDEGLGYVIAIPVSGNTQPTPIEGVFASVGFFRSDDLTDISFINLVNDVFNQNFITATEANEWLTNNGYWSSYDVIPPTPTPTSTSEVIPTPTPTPTSTSEVIPTPTPTPTSTSEVIPTPTPTPTSTSEVIPTPTPTPTSTSEVIPTPTPTPTSGATPSGFTVNLSEVGPNVVMSASGTLNINDLTFVNSSNFIGTGGLGVDSATFIMGSNGDFSSYSGFTTTPSNLGSGSGAGASSGSGDVFGVIFQSAPPYQLVVPSGYTTGQSITSTQTFNSQTFSSMGLTPGTYTYTWGSGANADAINVVVGGPSPTPTPTPTQGGSGAWYFYQSTEGPLTVGPPESQGDSIFTTDNNANVTYNPNSSGGTNMFLYFNRYDNNGTDYGIQFNDLMNLGGSISMTQNGQTATYSTSTPNDFQYNSSPNGFLIINVNIIPQTASTASPFVYGDPISLSFG